MLTHFLLDFEERRRRLHPAIQGPVDDLIYQIRRLAETMCELSAQYQAMTIEIAPGTRLFFVLDTKARTLSIMFMDSQS